MGCDAEMAVRVPMKLTAAQVRAESVRMVKALGMFRFWVFPPGEYGEKKGHHALEIADEHYGVKAEGDDQTIVAVHLGTRYYGPGYERGDLVTILAVARWLRGVWPTATLYYGGDSGERID